MPRKLLKRILPSRETIKSHRWLRPIEQFLHRENLWHIHQRSIAKAAFIGIFVAFLPLPAHTLIAAALAVVIDANLIGAIACSWIVNNPISMGFLFYADYRVGAALWGSHVTPIKFELTWQWLNTVMPVIGLELFTGALICGLTLGCIGYGCVRGLWRWHVSRQWQLRSLRKQ